jgi:hypothetical protein
MAKFGRTNKRVDVFCVIFGLDLLCGGTGNSNQGKQESGKNNFVHLENFDVGNFF